MEQDETVLTVAGSPVRTYRAGRGPAVVLLHGGGLDSALLTWEPVWPLLTERARVLAPDLPGFAGTPLGSTTPTLAGYRDWLLDFLNAAEVDRAVIAGLSLGGGIALQTALDAPARVAGLLLCAPYGISSRLPGGYAGYLAVRTPGVAALVDTVLRHSDVALRRTLATLLRRPGAVTAELVARVRAQLGDPDAGAAWAAFQHHEVRWSGPRTNLTAELSRIAAPAVLLSGRLDSLVPSEDVRAAVQRMSAGRYVDVPGAGHWLPRDAPAPVAAELLGLLERTT